MFAYSSYVLLSVRKGESLASQSIAVLANKAAPVDNALSSGVNLGL